MPDWWGEYQIEALARIPVEVEYASELRYSNPPLGQNSLLFAITQSGETADTLAALREMKRKGYPHDGDLQRGREHDCPGSPRRHLLACRSGDRRGVHQGLHVAMHGAGHVGPCTSAACTTSATTREIRAIERLQELPDKVSGALETNDRVKEIAEKYADCSNFLYLGRQFNFPAALEGALKLKEISYIHAEGYPAAEMKHGPIALVDKKHAQRVSSWHATPSTIRSWQTSRRSKLGADR